MSEEKPLEDQNVKRCIWKSTLIPEYALGHQCERDAFDNSDFCLFHKPDKDQTESILFWECINYSNYKILFETIYKSRVTNNIQLLEGLDPKAVQYCKYGINQRNHGDFTGFSFPQNDLSRGFASSNLFDDPEIQIFKFVSIFSGEKIIFDEAIFNCGISFSGYKFLEFTSFRNTRFEKSMDFQNSIFYNGVIFKNVKFASTSILPFYGTKFGGVSCTIISNKMGVSLFGCEFGHHTSFKLEIDLNGSEFSEKAFRLAAKHAISQLNYEEGDKYEFLERKNHRLSIISWNSMFKKRLLKSNIRYYLFSIEGWQYLIKWFVYYFMEESMGYGTRPFNLILFSLASIILFSLIYQFSGLQVPSNVNYSEHLIDYQFGIKYFMNLFDVEYLKKMILDFKECLFYSTSIFCTATFGVTPLTNWGEFWTSIEMILGVFTFGSFVAVFLRKILR